MDLLSLRLVGVAGARINVRSSYSQQVFMVASQAPLLVSYSFIPFDILFQNMFTGIVELKPRFTNSAIHEFTAFNRRHSSVNVLFLLNQIELPIDFSATGVNSAGIDCRTHYSKNLNSNLVQVPGLYFTAAMLIWALVIDLE